jgi:hypothetical protein
MVQAIPELELTAEQIFQGTLLQECPLVIPEESIECDRLSASNFKNCIGHNWLPFAGYLPRCNYGFSVPLRQTRLK